MTHFPTFPPNTLDLASFSPDEREVLLLIASRIDAARAQYGPLQIDSDDRDFEYEGYLEVVDKTVYDTIEIIKRRRKRARKAAEKG